MIILFSIGNAEDKPFKIYLNEKALIIKDKDTEKLIKNLIKLNENLRSKVMSLENKIDSNFLYKPEEWPNDHYSKTLRKKLLKLRKENDKLNRQNKNLIHMNEQLKSNNKNSKK